MSRNKRAKKKKESWQTSLKIMKKAIAELARENKRTSEQNRIAIQRLSEENRKTSEEIRRLSVELKEFKNSVSRLTDGWGRFVEGIVEPSCVEFFKRKGFRILKVYQRARASSNGRNVEYDLLIVGETAILLVSAKVHVRAEDINDLIDDLKEFFEFMPEYRGKILWGAIAGTSYAEGVDTYAKRQGLFVIKPSGEAYKVEEPDTIKDFSLNQ